MFISRYVRSSLAVLIASSLLSACAGTGGTNTTDSSTTSTDSNTSNNTNTGNTPPSSGNNTGGSSGGGSTGSTQDPTAFSNVLIPISYNCADADILCVDDTAGATQEYSTIQAAVNAASAGDTVIVHAGTYAGFTVNNSGTADNNRLIVTANGNNVLINSGGSSEGRVLVSNSDYVTIEGFTIEGASGYCLAARDASATSPMHGVSFQFNTVRNCGSTNIYMSQAADSLILGNVSYNSLTSHGIYLSNAGSDNDVIKANRCYGNAKNGLHFNGDISNGGDGLHSNITVDSNVFYDNTANGIDADGVYDSLFINNLIYGNGGRGIRGFQIDAAAGVANLTFINNTIVNNAGWGIRLTEDAGGHVFFNNVIMGNGDACIATDNSNLQSDNNIYSTGCSFTVNNEATVLNYTSWTTTYSDSSIQSSIATVLTNAGADDYTLAAASPAIDTGLASFASHNAPAEDIEGISRPNGVAVDIGAFEH